MTNGCLLDLEGFGIDVLLTEEQYWELWEIDSALFWEQRVGG